MGNVFDHRFHMRSFGALLKSCLPLPLPHRKKALFLTLLLSLLLGLGGAAGWGKPNQQDLVGQWRVDLRATPEAAPYYQELRIDSVKGDTLEGSFFGSRMEHGRLNTDWGTVYIAFVTQDGKGAVHHAGRLRRGKLEGTSLSLGREVLSVWRAERAE